MTFGISVAPLLKQNIILIDSQLITQKLNSSKFTFFLIGVPAAIGLSFPLVYLSLKSL